jgi:8-oxo-dGTP pyrophosphatase MutT (NUDIX family)
MNSSGEHQMIKEYSAGIVIFRINNGQREYLLLHYSSGHWDFPKGHIEPGESKEEAALRELDEETGLHAAIINGFEESFSYYHRLPPSGELAYKTVYFFVGQVSTKASISLSHEHQNYCWLSAKAAIDKLTYDNAKQLLQHVDLFLAA